MKVRVEAGASVQRVARFLRELRREQEILMQQMVSDRSDGTHIWLGLRKPLPLQEILLQMESVSRVECPRGLKRIRISLHSTSNWWPLTTIRSSHTRWPLFSSTIGKGA